MRASDELNFPFSCMELELLDGWTGNGSFNHEIHPANGIIWGILESNELILRGESDANGVNLCPVDAGEKRAKFSHRNACFEVSEVILFRKISDEPFFSWKESELI